MVSKGGYLAYDQAIAYLGDNVNIDLDLNKQVDEIKE